MGGLNASFQHADLSELRWTLGRKSEFTLTYLGYHHLTRVFGPLRCEVCKGPIEIGDNVVTKQGCAKYKIYHKNCWETLFIEVEA